jgi:hypothetical protein
MSLVFKSGELTQDTGRTVFRDATVPGEQYL